MKKVIKKEIKRRNIDEHIKKTEKSKLGGIGQGGVYRSKETGKDYLVKRVSANSYTDEEKRELNWRSWDEILAGRFLKHAGVLVPNMFAIEDSKQLIHVASAMLPGAKNCTKEMFSKLPLTSKEPVFVSVMMHCWLGNRDIINNTGENFVIDQDRRVFHVDLGASLFSGFRSITGDVEDDKNFGEKNSFLSTFLDRDNLRFSQMVCADGTKITTKNKKATESFFDEYFAKQRQYHLQGVLMLQKFNDKDIADLVNSTGLTPQQKQKRIKALIERRDEIVSHMENKYGKNALMEEQISMELQRIYHKNGVFNQFNRKGKGEDAYAAYTAQFANALKLSIKINMDGTFTIEGPFQVRSATVS